MGARGQHPDVQTYAVLLDGLFKKKNFAKAMALFREMEDNKLHHNTMIYNILIDGLCNAKEVTIARKIFYCLPTKGLQHDDL